MSLILEQIKKNIYHSDILLFLGAGISINSGIPLVGGFYDKSPKIINGVIPYILKKIGFSYDDLVGFFNTKIPFELFVQILTENGIELKSLSQIFDAQPSLYHYWIADLVKNLQIKRIITTNFDTCIEQACKESGSILEKRVDVHQLSYNDQKKEAILYKIHGCISNPSELGITIRNISNKERSDKIGEIERFFLKNNLYSKILFIGYSCSDYFDINKLLQGLPKKYTDNELCEIYYIEYVKHASLCKMNDHIYNQNVVEVFADFPKFSYLKGDPAHLIEKKVSIVKRENNWQDKLDKVFVDLDKYDKKYMKVKIFQTINDNNKAFKILEELENDKISSKMMINVKRNLSIILRNWGRYDTALKYTNELVDYAEKNIDLRELAISMGHRAVIERDLGRFTDALSTLKLVEQICIQIKDDFLLMVCYNTHGIILNEQGHYKEALEMHEKQEKICDILGDLSTKANAMANKAIVYYSMQKYSDALSVHNIEENLKNKLSDKKGLSRCYGNMANIYLKLGQIEKSLEYFRKEEDLKIELDDRSGLIKSYSGQAELYSRIGDLDMAEYLYKKQIELSNEPNADLAIAYFGLGKLYFYKKNNKNNAFDYFLKSHALAKQMKLDFLSELEAVISDLEKKK